MSDPTAASPSDNHRCEVTIVMPCLNEEEAVGQCVDSAFAALDKFGLAGEVLVVDNGSTDRSVAIAHDHGARVVHQPVRGYGAAYLKGFDEARGRYVLMADADNTYDFMEMNRFMEQLRGGSHLVMGARFKGKIMPGAMSWTHRYIGNPILSGILNLFFHSPISDAHCGMRAFDRAALPKMRLRTTGMEFASEMVINAAKAGLTVTEVPITYHPRAGESKLRSFRDAWRHLRFMLLYSPTHLFLIPGLALTLLGLIPLLALLPGPIVIAGRAYDIHLMLAGSLATILGIQAVSMGLFAKTYALVEGFEERDPWLERFSRYFTLERGLLVGFAMFALGLVIFLYVVVKWALAGFGALSAVRPELFGITFMVIGAQVMFSSFFLGILRIERRR